MKKFFIVLFALSTLCAAGCNPEEFFDREVDAYGLQYIERMVVEGMLVDGRTVDSIKFSRTLPLTEKYTWQKAMLTTVTAEIRVDGATYPLRHIGNGKYDVPGLLPQSGKTYSLTAEWNGMKISATTMVPVPATIDTVILDKRRYTWSPDYEYYYATILFRPVDANVYRTATLRPYNFDRDTISQQFGPYDYVAQRKDTTDDGRVHIGEALHMIYDTTRMNRYNFLLTSLDNQYYDFFMTFSKYQGDNPFGNGMQLIHWNVKGDGMGLFIGTSSSRKTIMVKG